MTSKQVMKLLESDGWYEVKGKASGHRHFKHNFKPGKVTVPVSRNEIPKGTLNAILKQAGLK